MHKLLCIVEFVLIAQLVMVYTVCLEKRTANSHPGNCKQRNYAVPARKEWIYRGSVI